MKVTLDHNCIIRLMNRTYVGQQVDAIARDTRYECFVVNIGTSEMHEKGVRPDNYETFEQLLRSAGVSELPRLNPITILDVTFWDRSVWSSAELDEQTDAINEVSFGKVSKIDIGTVGLNSPEGKKWINRMCDIQGMWCHRRNENDLFLTTDGNFRKTTRLPKLVALGAGRIPGPDEL